MSSKDVKEMNKNAKEFLFELDDKSWIDGLIREDGKVKLLIDTFNGEWRQTWQTPRETSKGFYVKLYGERTYLTNI